MEHEIAYKIEGLMFTPAVVLTKAAQGEFTPVKDNDLVRCVLAGAPTGALFYIDENCNDYFEGMDIIYVVGQDWAHPSKGIDMVIQAMVWSGEHEGMGWQAEVVNGEVSDWDRIN